MTTAPAPITVRHFRRLKARFREAGVAGVPHGLRGRPSNRQLGAALHAPVATLMQTTYAGFNDVHLTEKLREVHSLAVSRASVRRLRPALGLPAQRPRRAPAHRHRRPRDDVLRDVRDRDSRPRTVRSRLRAPNAASCSRYSDAHVDLQTGRRRPGRCRVDERRPAG